MGVHAGFKGPHLNCFEKYLQQAGHDVHELCSMLGGMHVCLCVHSISIVIHFVQLEYRAVLLLGTSRDNLPCLACLPRVRSPSARFLIFFSCEVFEPRVAGFYIMGLFQPNVNGLR